MEQIKNDVAYSDRPVVLVGISAGVSYGALGATHHAVHDLAALRAIPNITVVVPADNYETRCAVRAAAAADCPVYLRFGKRPMPDLHKEVIPFEFGRAITLRRGGDVTYIACGETVCHALAAADLLASEEVLASVISMHTVKPLDSAAVQQAARDLPGDRDRRGAQRPRRVGRGLRGGADERWLPGGIRRRGLPG